MRKLKSYTILFLALALGTIACDVSLGDKGDYTVRAVNGTGGMLSEVVVGSVTCTDVMPDGVCESASAFSPNEITISYKAKLAAGLGEDLSKEVTLTPAAGTSETEHLITLGDTYAALWLENSNESKNIDMIGINFSGSGTLDTLSEIPTGSTDYGYSNFQNITGEAIIFSEIADDSPVIGTLANAPFSLMSIKAKVHRNLTVDVADEALTATDVGGDGDLDATLAHSVVADQTNLMKSSIVLKGISGGVSTIIATDDGTGNLIPATADLNGEGTNSIEYDSGAVQFTLADGVTFDSYAVDYRYLDSVNLDLVQTPIEGTVKIKTGDTVLAADDGEGEFSGDNVAGASSIDYSGKSLVYLASDSTLYNKAAAPDHIIIEYDYIMAVSGPTGHDNYGIDGAQTLLTYATGEYTIYFDVSEIGSELAVQALYTDYHVAMAAYTEDNYSVDPVPADAENLAFDADARSVAAKLTHTFVDSGSVSITATYVDDPAVPTDTQTVTITDAAVAGILNDGSVDVGTINYDSGKILLNLTSHHSGYTLTGVEVTAYNYRTAGGSQKAWGGFFKKSKLEDIYGITMDSEGATIDGYWTLDVDDADYTTNSHGAYILNMICGRLWTDVN